MSEFQDDQDEKKYRELYKQDRGAIIAFKRNQMVELVPFFVHPQFKTEADILALCRIPHYLRVSPSFIMGNIIAPYPMHLGESLIEDVLCIVDAEG